MANWINKTQDVWTFQFLSGASQSRVCLINTAEESKVELKLRFSHLEVEFTLFCDVMWAKTHSTEPF